MTTKSTQAQFGHVPGAVIDRGIPAVLLIAWARFGGLLNDGTQMKRSKATFTAISPTKAPR